MVLFYSVIVATVSSVTVDATIVDRDSHWEGGLIVTDTSLRIDRVRRGQAPGELVVRQLGGVVDGIAQVASDQSMLPTSGPVSIELDRNGATWRLAGDDVPAPEGFVRNTTTAANPGCGGEPMPLAWRSGSVRYVVDARGVDDVSPAAAQAGVQAAFETWNAVECSYLDMKYGGSVEDPQAGYNGHAENAVIWVESDWPGNRNALAITLLTFHCHNGEVIDADILVNSDDFSFAANEDVDDDVDDDGNDDGVDRDLQNILTHEAGHVVGFAHSPDTESTMYATIKPREQRKRDLTDSDAAGMCEAYSVETGPPAEDPALGCAIVSPGGTRPATGAGMLALGGLGLLVTAALVRRRRARDQRIGPRSERDPGSAAGRRLWPQSRAARAHAVDANVSE